MYDESGGDDDGSDGDGDGDGDGGGDEKENSWDENNEYIIQVLNKWWTNKGTFKEQCNYVKMCLTRTKKDRSTRWVTTLIVTTQNWMMTANVKRFMLQERKLVLIITSMIIIVMMIMVMMIMVMEMEDKAMLCLDHDHDDHHDNNYLFDCDSSTSECFFSNNLSKAKSPYPLLSR